MNVFYVLCRCGLFLLAQLFPHNSKHADGKQIKTAVSLLLFCTVSVSLAKKGLSRVSALGLFSQCKHKHDRIRLENGPRPFSVRAYDFR